MKHNKLWLAATAACLITASAGLAGPKRDTATPAVITLRDCAAGFPSAAFANRHPGTAPGDLCPVQDDRIKSDTGMSYVDGEQLVEASISQDIWLKLANSPRGLFLDFTDCASPPADCNPPFLTDVISRAAIKVNGNGALQSMTTGESITAPMRVYYEFFVGQGPGFVDFNPNLVGKNNPCKNKSNFITVTRTGDTTWEVIADPNTIGCVILPGTGGTGFGGTYRMPFQFTVQKK